MRGFKVLGGSTAWPYVFLNLIIYLDKSCTTSLSGKRNEGCCHIHRTRQTKNGSGELLNSFAPIVVPLPFSLPYL